MPDTGDERRPGRRENDNPYHRSKKTPCELGNYPCCGRLCGDCRRQSKPRELNKPPGQYVWRKSDKVEKAARPVASMTKAPAQPPTPVPAVTKGTPAVQVAFSTAPARAPILCEDGESFKICTGPCNCDGRAKVHVEVTVNGLPFRAAAETVTEAQPASTPPSLPVPTPPATVKRTVTVVRKRESDGIEQPVFKAPRVTEGHVGGHAER